MKIIFMTLAFVGMMFTSVMADSLITIDPSKISAEQLKQVQSIVNVPTKETVTDTLSSYAQVGKDIGVGIAEAAKQLGIAAAEFANTPAGMIAIGVIVWKVILADMLTSVFLFILGVVWAGAVYTQFKKQIVPTNHEDFDGERFAGMFFVAVGAMLPAIAFILVAVN